MGWHGVTMPKKYQRPEGGASVDVGGATVDVAGATSLGGATFIVIGGDGWSNVHRHWSMWVKRRCTTSGGATCPR